MTARAVKDGGSRATGQRRVRVSGGRGQPAADPRQLWRGGLTVAVVGAGRRVRRGQFRGCVLVQLVRRRAVCGSGGRRSHGTAASDLDAATPVHDGKQKSAHHTVGVSCLLNEDHDTVIPSEPANARRCCSGSSRFFGMAPGTGGDFISASPLKSVTRGTHRGRRCPDPYSRT